MKDNTVTTADGIEVYKHNIKYYADEYITNELDIDHVDQDNKQIVKDNFVDMLFYISDHITKPDNADIKALDYIFNVYVRLCSKYGVNPTLEACQQQQWAITLQRAQADMEHQKNSEMKCRK